MRLSWLWNMNLNGLLYLTVVLICISLMIRGIEHLFKCLLAFCVCFFGKMSIQVPCLFFNQVVFVCLFLILSCMSSLCIQDINSLSDISFVNIFSHSIGWPFHFVDGFLCCAEAFYMDVVPLVYLCFCCPCLRRHNPKNCAKNGIKGLRTCFILGVL